MASKKKNKRFLKEDYNEDLLPHQLPGKSKQEVKKTIIHVLPEQVVAEEEDCGFKFVRKHPKRPFESIKESSVRYDLKEEDEKPDPKRAKRTRQEEHEEASISSSLIEDEKQEGGFYTVPQQRSSLKLSDYPQKSSSSQLTGKTLIDKKEIHEYPF
jgi:hypothetical protein